jgi:hypothetical protein
MMMPMVDWFATLEQIKKRRTIATLRLLSCKNKEKDIEKDFHWVLIYMFL